MLLPLTNSGRLGCAASVAALTHPTAAAEPSDTPLRRVGYSPITQGSGGQRSWSKTWLMNPDRLLLDAAAKGGVGLSAWEGLTGTG